MKYIGAAFVALIAIILLTYPPPDPRVAVFWRALGWAHLAAAFLVFVPDAWRLPQSQLSKGVRAVLARVWLMLAGVLVVWGLAVAAGGVADIARGDLGGIVAFVAAALELTVAHALARPSLRWARERRLAERERADRARVVEVAMLRAAHDLGGRITCADAVVRMGLPLDDAQSTLEALAARGACERLVTASGATLYRFAELEPGIARVDLLEPGHLR